MEISIKTIVEAPLRVVWNAWVTPEDIKNWNFANDEWCCPSAEINLRLGGRFNYRMEAKDNSMGFDFEGEFTVINLHESIHYKLGDSREVRVEFSGFENSTTVVETFDAEGENSGEQQRQGWLKILENFKKYVENKSN